MKTHHTMGKGLLFAVCLLLNGALYQAADVSYIVSALSQHFSKPRITTGGTGSTSYKDLSKVFIYEEFKKCGLTTDYQDCTGTKEPCTNVVGVLEGERFGKAEDHVMGIGGNYDTDTLTNSSGVNENGAGVAAMLEVARQLTKGATKRQNTMLFVAFDRHYTDFQGSRSFIVNWLNPWLGRNYGEAAQTLPAYGVIVVHSLMKYTSVAHSHEFPATLDALKGEFPKTMQNIAADNFTGDFLSLVYRKLERTRDTFLASTFKKFWAGEGNPEFELETFPLPLGNVSVLQNNEATRPFMGSEHAVFWQDNIPSIFLSDLGRMRGHEADDMSSMLTYDNIMFLAKTTDVIAKTMDKLSEPLTSHVVTTGATDIATGATDKATCKDATNAAATSVNSFMLATYLTCVLAYSSTMIW